MIDPSPKDSELGNRLGIALIACIGLGAILYSCKEGKAHDAVPTAAQPMGWRYGFECCSAADCSQVQQSTILETPKGYEVAATGEVIPYNDKRIKRSKDEFFHRCAPSGDMTAPKSICLYVPDRSF